MKINLSRTSWHRRLQRYVLGLSTYRADDFPNLCPYFWLTVFCLLVVPFVWFFRVPIMYTGQGVAFAFVGVGKGIEFGAMAVAMPINEYICKPLDRMFVIPRIKSLDPEQIIKLGNSHKDKDEAVFRRWRETIGDDWRATYDKYLQDVRAQRRAAAEKKDAEDLAKHRARMEEDRKEYAARKARQERLMRIAAKTQLYAPYVLITLAGCIALLVVPLLVKLVMVIAGAPWAAIGHGAFVALYWVGVVGTGLALAAAVGVFLFILFKKLFRKCWLLFCVPFKTATAKAFARRISRALERVIVPVGNRVVVVAEVIADSTLLLRQYVKATKDGYCPKIDWEE